MDEAAFKNLQVGEYFYDENSGDEWLVEGKSYSAVDALCTKESRGFRKGTRAPWMIKAARFFTKGRHPNSEQ